MNETTEARTGEKPEEIACEFCGRFGAVAFEGHQVCADCYQARCSCCSEFCEEDTDLEQGRESARTGNRGGSDAG